MRDRLEEFGDAEVVVVVHARPRTLHGYRARFLEPLTVATDESLATYGAFGFGRSAADGSQLGGDVVVDGAGRIAMLHRQATSRDRPSIDDLVSAVAAASGR
ncbi:MAG TPA: hypothetical protein VHN98_03955 [Acidimicrobiales bacterium]|nr:hypothetical protein [Acidimicrobiales bacterium]